MRKSSSVRQVWGPRVSFWGFFSSSPRDMDHSEKLNRNAKTDNVVRRDSPRIAWQRRSGPSKHGQARRLCAVGDRVSAVRPKNPASIEYRILAHTRLTPSARPRSDCCAAPPVPSLAQGRFPPLVPVAAPARPNSACLVKDRARNVDLGGFGVASPNRGVTGLSFSTSPPSHLSFFFFFLSFFLLAQPFRIIFHRPLL